MRVVHFNTIDQGGSYKAAVRIHRGLIMAGAHSSLLLRTKSDKSGEGCEVIDRPAKSLLSKAKNVGNLLLSTDDIITDMFGTEVTRLDKVQNADAIIIHWCNSFLGYKQYRKLASLGKPVLVVGHDMWACTGGCHYDEWCGEFEDGCRDCPMAKKGFLPGMRQRIVNANYNAKIKAFSNLSYVGVSNWSLSVAERSPIWKNNHKCVILNPVDYDVFHPTSVTKYEYLRDNSDQKIILYGAARTFSQKYKGGDDLIRVIDNLHIDNYKVVIFGNVSDDAIKNIRFPLVNLGYIDSEHDMAQLYSFADVFVNTSFQESFCYTVGEALACHTPVVAYGVGGINDQVQHKVNGYLVPVGNTEELAGGIEYCLTHEMTSINLHNSLMETGKRYLGFIKDISQ